MIDTNAKTRAEARSRAWRFGKCEAYYNYAYQDLLGLFDYLAFTETYTIGIQSTTRDHLSGHLIKMFESEHLRPWVTLEDRWAVLWCWGRKQNAGGEIGRRLGLLEYRFVVCPESGEVVAKLIQDQCYPKAAKDGRHVRPVYRVTDVLPEID